MLGHFCRLLLPSQSHLKSGTALEAPLSTPLTGATTLSKTPQKDDCSSLPAPGLLRKRQSSAGKVLTTSRKPSEEGEMVHFHSHILRKQFGLQQLNFADINVLKQKRSLLRQCTSPNPGETCQQTWQLITPGLQICCLLRRHEGRARPLQTSPLRVPRGEGKAGLDITDETAWEPVTANQKNKGKGQ